MKYGYVIGNSVRIGELGSGAPTFRTNIPDSEIATSYIIEGKVNLFAREEDAAKYARTKREDFSEITQPAYFYVEIRDNANMEEKEEVLHIEAVFDGSTGIPRCISHSSVYKVSFYEIDAAELTPIRGQISKNVRFSVELTAEGKPLHDSIGCTIS
ncbi:MAG: hypothetical protein K0U37_03715 [Gammaproteobacteria bacterium]|nr:hypothetical protein [Gammaproteobacteria bacterium]